MTENLMTDEDYLRALRYSLENPTLVSIAINMQAIDDRALGRRVRETLILAGFGPDADIPDPETLRRMVEAWRNGEELRREFAAVLAKGPPPMVMRLSPSLDPMANRGITPEVPKDGC